MKNEIDKKMSGSKLTGQEISTYFRKNPKAKAVRKAVEIALDHGGAMTFATKEIEKLKRGLSNHPEVKKALQYANESVHIARNTFKKIVTENYTKNFELLCQSLKFNKIQQRILDQFISHGTIKNQYVGRVAGRKKETKIFAAKKKYTGSHESRKGALMQALKVNAHQKKILDSYLKTGRVIGKYAGSIAGSTKTTKDYAGFRGFKESFDNDLIEGTITTSVSDPKENKLVQTAKKAGLKVKIQPGKGDGMNGDDLATFTGPDAKLIKYFEDHMGFEGGNISALKKEFESVEEDKRYVKGGFTFKVEGKPKKGQQTPDTMMKPSQKKMWPSVKLKYLKGKDEWKATGNEKDLERMAWAVDQSKHLKRTSGRLDGILINPKPGER